MKTDKVLVACPKCGHTQHEPATAYSSVCKQCRQYFRLEDVLRAAAQAGAARSSPQKESRHVRCFQCGTELEVSPSAQSTMCKRCSSHLDLRDYIIANAVSKNFRTRGRFVVEEGGYVFNTESFVADAIIKGRFHGKLIADYTLEIHRTAELKGSFRAGKLIIPSGCTFRWPDPIQIGGGDIHGELIGNVRSEGTVILRASARFFGNMMAGGLVVESGAVLEGEVRLGPEAAAEAKPAEIRSAVSPSVPVHASPPEDEARPASSEETAAPAQLELAPIPPPPPAPAPAAAPTPRPTPGIARSGRPPAPRATSGRPPPSKSPAAPSKPPAPAKAPTKSGSSTTRRKAAD